MTSSSVLHAAIAAAKRGQRTRARNLLLELVEEEPYNELAWLWLSDLVDDLQDQIIALENALNLNPERPQVWARLERLRVQQAGMHSFTEERVSAINLHLTGQQLAAAENQLKTEGIKVTSPTTTLVRLAAGPLILYCLLLFIHSGLNPLQMSLMLFLGGFGVLLGSLLVIGTSNTPDHPVWQKAFGPEGLNDSFTRTLLHILGILLILVPFMVFGMNAMNRLEVYRASLW